LEIAAREESGNGMREFAESLEAQVRTRTEEVEQRNKQLAEARARLAEEKLFVERSEAHMAEAQRLSNTGSWYFNVRTGEHFWSNESFDILGLDSRVTKPSYRLLLERMHPEDRSRFDQIRSTAIAEKRDFEAEFRLLLPGGVIKYAHGIGHCLMNESGDCEFIGANDGYDRTQTCPGRVGAAAKRFWRKLSASARRVAFPGASRQTKSCGQSSSIAFSSLTRVCP
jgi:PAS domain-containing protein